LSKFIVRTVRESLFREAVALDWSLTRLFLQHAPVLESLLKAWPSPINNPKRVKCITFGGIELHIDRGQTWDYLDIEEGATLAASVVPLVLDKYNSIQDAIEAAVDGDTVWLGPGVYQEKIDVRKSLNIIAEKAGTVTLRQPDTPWSTETDRERNTPVVWAAAHYGGMILLSGIRVEGLGSSVKDMVDKAIPNSEMAFLEMGTALKAHYEEGQEPNFKCKGVEVVRGQLQLVRCSVLNFGSYGITVGGENAHVEVRRCEIHSNADGLRAKKGGTARVQQTELYGHTGCVVHAIGSGTTINLEQCVMAQNGDGLCVCCAEAGDVAMADCVISTTRESAFYNHSGVLRLEETTCDVRESSQQTMHVIQEELAEERKPELVSRPWYDLTWDNSPTASKGPCGGRTSKAMWYNRCGDTKRRAKRTYTIFRNDKRLLRP